MQAIGVHSAAERCRGRAILLAALLVAAVGAAGGCTMPIRRDTPPVGPPPGTIIDGRTGAAVGFEAMLRDARTARILFIGEQHTSAAHHAVQLKVIEALHRDGASIALGLEMFDRSYQPVLDLWSAGGLDEEAFLRRTHWYANWRFDYGLYREILDFARREQIPVFGLNLPFHLPPKIRVGGIEHLPDHEKQFLPREIDTGVSAHRAYVEKIFAQHGFKNTRFEDFYLAQCAWDEAMAEAAAAVSTELLVILAGNGHIQYRYGIPERLHRRNSLPYRTLYLAPSGPPIDPAIADFIWVTD
jgi:uncharacterized iron-regulated protein